MRHIDKYYFFLFKALSEPNESPNYRYYLNSVEKVLIMKTVSCANFEISKNWIELPKLTYFEKKNFLDLFSSKQKKLFKKELDKIIIHFKENSNFNLLNEFKEIDLGLAMNFDIESATFLNQAIERLYSNFNLDENILIDFSDVQKGGNSA